MQRNTISIAPPYKIITTNNLGGYWGDLPPMGGLGVPPHRKLFTDIQIQEALREAPPLGRGVTILRLPQKFFLDSESYRPDRVCPREVTREGTPLAGTRDSGAYE